MPVSTSAKSLKEEAESEVVRVSGAQADGHLLHMHASHACAAKLNREHPLIRLAQVIVRLVASPLRRQLPRTRPRDARTHPQLLGVHALNLTNSDRIAYWQCNIPIKVGSQDELGCRLGETDNPDRVGAMPAHAPAIPCADL